MSCMNFHANFVVTHMNTGCVGKGIQPQLFLCSFVGLWKLTIN